MTNLTRRAFGKFAFAATGAALVAVSARADGHAQNHAVTISGFAFSPANLTITRGDNVTFVNQDSAPHTATAQNGAFDTGRLGNDDNATLTFESAGSFEYFCQFHPMMKGAITITG